MTLPEPFYDDGLAIVFHADCRDILPLLDLDPAKTLVLTDPPYGVREPTNRHNNKRGSSQHHSNSSLGGGGGKWPSRDWPAIADDHRPYDPTHLLAWPRLILFGANHYANRLPPSPSWIVWDKLDGLSSANRIIGVDDNADLELAWTNLGGPARLIPHRWKGLIRASERSERALHPTQKPVVLMRLLIEWRTEPTDVVLDPYMGSGPVLRAAKDLGRKAVGIEVEERYCQTAVKRLRQEVLPLGDFG